MAAGMHIAGLGVSLGMGGADERVHFAHNGDGGAGAAGVHIHIEAGDIAGQNRLVAQLPVLLQQILVGFPLPVAGFRIFPHKVHGIQRTLGMLLNCLHKLFHK